MKKLLLIFLLFINSEFISFAQTPSILWEKSFGGSGDDEAYSIKQTKDGGYIVAGYSNSNNGDVTLNSHSRTYYNNYWLLKLNSSGSIQWENTYGGNLDDKAQCAQQTSDGGYIVAGYSNSTEGDVNLARVHGGYDFWIVKLSSSGDTIWENPLGGSSNEYAYSVQQTTDGGFIVVGETSSNNGDVSGNHGGFDCWVVKLANSGIIQWQKCYGGKGNESGNAIRQTTDGGYVIAGQSDSTSDEVTGNHGLNDCWILKIDSVGSLQWEKSLGGSGNDYARSIQQTNDGGYIVGAYTNSNDGDVTNNHGLDDYWVIKLDAGGDTLWTKTYGGSDMDEGYSIQQTTDGGYIFGGGSRSLDGDVTLLHGNYDYWLIKIDTVGNLLWQKTMGGTNDDIAYCIQETSDMGCIIAGVSKSNDGDVTGNHVDSTGINPSNDFWVVKLDRVVGIEEQSNVISEFQISPNPISQFANISFSLSHSENVLIKICDLTGREIITLNNGYLGEGSHFLNWNSKNMLGSSIDNGIYFLTIEAANTSITKRIAVIK